MIRVRTSDHGFTTQLEDFNSEVAQWANSVNAKIKSNIASSGIKGERLKNSLKENLRKNNNEITSVSFRFLRHGIYVHVGAGRGYGGAKGSKWTNAKNESKSTKFSSLGKLNSGNRKAKPFFLPVLEENLESLQKIVSNYTENQIIGLVSSLK